MAFPINTQSLMIDTTINTYVTAVVKQGDISTRHLIVYVVNEGLPIDFSQYEKIYPVLRMLTPDGRHIWNHECIEIDGNKLNITLPEAALSYPGKATANIEIYDDALTAFDEKARCLSSICFYILVQQSAFTDEDIKQVEDWNVVGEIIGAARLSEVKAEAHAKAAKVSAETAKVEAVAAAKSGQVATTKALASKNSADNAADSAKLAQSWAEGGTKSRIGEDINNAKFHSDASKKSAQSAAASAVEAKKSETFINTNKTAIDKISKNVDAVVKTAQSIENVNTVSGDLNNINIVAARKENVDTVAGGVENIKNVSENISSVQTVGNNINNVNTVAKDKANIDAVAGNKTNIDTVVNNLTNVKAVGSNINNVNTVANYKKNIDTLLSYKETMDNVLADKANIDKVAEDKANIDIVAKSEKNISDLLIEMPTVNQVAGELTSIHAVGTNIANVNTVAESKDEIDAVIKNKANIDTLVENLLIIASVSKNIKSVETVANDKARIDSLAENEENLNKIAAALTNIIKVASDIENVNTVAGLKDAINNVVLNKSNINTTALNINDVRTVAVNIANILAVQKDIKNIDTVATNQKNISTVATNIKDINDAQKNAASIMLSLDETNKSISDAAKTCADVQYTVDQVLPSLIGIVGYTYMGDYDSKVQYDRYNTVDYNNEIWVCLKNNTYGIKPSESSFWHLLARRKEIVAAIEYNPNSESAMSGKAVKQACDQLKALFAEQVKNSTAQTEYDPESELAMSGIAVAKAVKAATDNIPKTYVVQEITDKNQNSKDAISVSGIVGFLKKKYDATITSLTQSVGELKTKVSELSPLQTYDGMSERAMSGKAIASAITDAISKIPKMNVIQSFTLDNRASAEPASAKAVNDAIDSSQSSLEKKISDETNARQTRDTQLTNSINTFKKEVGAINLIPYPYSEKRTSFDGLTFAYDSNGVITINGSSTQPEGKVTLFHLINTKRIDLPDGTYTFSGLPAYSDKIVVQIDLFKGTTFVKTIYTANKPGSFTIKKDSTWDSYKIDLRIKPGVIITNLVFKPMLVAGNVACDFVPYFAKGSLTTSLPKMIRDTAANLKSDYTEKIKNATAQTAYDSASDKPMSGIAVAEGIKQSETNLDKKKKNINSTLLVNGTDINTLWEEGSWYATGSNNCLNLPFSNTLGFYLTQIRTAGGQYQQILTPHSQVYFYTRISNNKNVWGNWFKLATTSDLNNYKGVIDYDPTSEKPMSGKAVAAAVLELKTAIDTTKGDLAAVRLTNEDLDDFYLKEGKYYAPGGHNCTNGPVSSNEIGFSLYVLRVGTQSTLEMAYTSNNQLYSRESGGAGWTSWVKLANTNDLKTFSAETTYNANSARPMSGKAVAQAINQNSQSSLRLDKNVITIKPEQWVRNVITSQSGVQYIYEYNLVDNSVTENTYLDGLIVGDNGYSDLWAIQSSDKKITFRITSKTDKTLQFRLFRAV